MNLNPQPDFFTLDEFASKLGVSKTTVESWVAQRQIESFKKGKVRKISHEAAVKFVLLNSVKPKRPDWLTADVESEWRKVLREEIRNVIREERELQPA